MVIYESARQREDVSLLKGLFPSGVHLHLSLLRGDCCSGLECWPLATTLRHYLANLDGMLLNASACGYRDHVVTECTLCAGHSQSGPCVK